MLIPAPGKDNGPCQDEGCEHPLCPALREKAAAACLWCQKPIGYNQPFEWDDEQDGPFHWGCNFETWFRPIERRLKRDPVLNAKFQALLKEHRNTETESGQ